MQKTKLIDPSKIKKTSGYATREAQLVLQKAYAAIEEYENFIRNAGAEPKAFREALLKRELSDKERSDLDLWKSSFKNEVLLAVTQKKKEMKAIDKLINGKKQTNKVSGRKRCTRIF